jgi:SPP1 gp7 family putative phage head morphogenesis protein
MIEDNPELLLELNTLAMKSRITRWESLQYEIDKQLNKLAITTEKETEELLKDTLKDNYNRNIYNISKKTGFLANFSGIDNKTIERVLSYEWSGNNYSGRIWNNKQQLSKTIKEEITQILIRGESSKKVSQRVATRMNASYKNAVRLVQTEHSYVMEQANKITYEDLKVEKYQFLATPDERTCKVCGNLDLKIFNVKDMIPGKNCSPLHPSCRCTSLLYYEDEDDENSTRFARDKNGKRIEIPSNMTFNEWKKKYID